MALVKVGTVIGPHGLKGDLKCAYITSIPEQIGARPVYLLCDPRTHEIEVVHTLSVRCLPDNFLIRFEEHCAPEPLTRFKGWDLAHCVKRGDLPREPGEIYTFELDGLEVRDAQGCAFAHVVDVFDNGISLLLELDLPGEPLVPFTSRYIPEVNLEAGYLVCTYPLTIREPKPPRHARKRGEGC